MPSPLSPSIHRDDGGLFLFNQPIGNVSPRPLGTTYEDTSFTYRHKNALFVTVDAFKLVGDGDSNYIDRTKGLGGEGAITCNVSGDHLDWFESVLVEARNDSSYHQAYICSSSFAYHPASKKGPLLRTIYGWS